MAFSPPPNRSAPSPLNVADNTTLYYLPICNALPAVREMIGTYDNSELCLYPGHRLAIQLCIMYHMRISETLAIRVIDEVTPSIWLIRALKRGRPYTIHIPVDPRNRAILSRMAPRDLILPFSYLSIWRAMVSAGMSLRVTGRVNRAVTHMGRFCVAQKLAQLNKTSNVTDVLHHKSASSRDYYLRGAPK